MDSLSAVEFRNRLSSELPSLNLPNTRLNLHRRERAFRAEFSASDTVVTCPCEADFRLPNDCKHSWLRGRAASDDCCSESGRGRTACARPTTLDLLVKRVRVGLGAESRAIEPRKVLFSRDHRREVWTSSCLLLEWCFGSAVSHSSHWEDWG